MRSVNMEYLIHATRSHHTAKFGGKDKFIEAIQASIEVGIVVPSLLRKNLIEAGYEVYTDETEKGRKKQTELGFPQQDFLTDVAIVQPDAKKRDENGIEYRGPLVVAYGAAGDVSEAIAHAALGYVRERDIEHFGKQLPNQFHTDPAEGEKVEIGDNATDVKGQPLSSVHRKNLKAHFAHRSEWLKARAAKAKRSK